MSSSLTRPFGMLRMKSVASVLAASQATSSGSSSFFDPTFQSGAVVILVLSFFGIDRHTLAIGGWGARAPSATATGNALSTFWTTDSFHSSTNTPFYALFRCISLMSAGASETPAPPKEFQFQLQAAINAFFTCVNTFSSSHSAGSTPMESSPSPPPHASTCIAACHCSSIVRSRSFCQTSVTNTLFTSYSFCVGFEG